jgi:hypothetical protein
MTEGQIDDLVEITRQSIVAATDELVREGIWHG